MLTFTGNCSRDIRRAAKRMDDATAHNLEYFDRLYDSRSLLVRRIHTRISFNQQSKHRANRRVVDPVLREALAEGRSAKVLDYGCGWGAFLIGLPARGVAAYGYDLSPRAMNGLDAVMKRLGRTLHRIAFDENGHITPDDFDLIVCSHVLEHVEDDAALLLRMVRALRSGGHLLVNVPVNEVWQDPRHVRSYVPPLLRERLTAAGVEIVGEWQLDRWSTFLRRFETGNRVATVRRVCSRGLRALLALTPYGALRCLENLLLRREACHQLLILSRKLDFERGNS